MVGILAVTQGSRNSCNLAALRNPAEGGLSLVFKITSFLNLRLEESHT